MSYRTKLFTLIMLVVSVVLGGCGIGEEDPTRVLQNGNAADAGTQVVEPADKTQEVGTQETTADSSTADASIADASTEPPADAQAAPDDAQQAQPGTFQLLEGWELHPDTTLSARWPHRPKDSAIPYVVMNIDLGGNGNDADAKKLAEEYFALQLEMNEEKPPTFSEVELAGRKAYVIELNTDSYWGGFWWNTSVYFEKDGQVVLLTIDDRLQNQQEAVIKAIETLKTN